MASRYITNIVNNDYIVCHGYVNIFYRLLAEAGIRVMKLKLSMKQGEKTIQHVRSVALVVDEKYGLNCYCVFDPTFDSSDKNKYYYIVKDEGISISEEKKEGYQNTDSLCLYKYFLVPLPLYEATFPNSFDENLTTRKNKEGNKKITYEGLHTRQLAEGATLTNMEFLELLYNVKLAEGYSEDEIPILISQSFALSKNKKFTTNSIVEAIAEIKKQKGYNGN